MFGILNLVWIWLYKNVINLINVLIFNFVVLVEILVFVVWVVYIRLFNVLEENWFIFIIVLDEFINLLVLYK